MTLSEWLRDNFKHITLSTQILSKGTTLSVPELNVDLTVGLISTDNKDEFKKLVFNYIPVGTIIDEIDDEWYETKLLAVRNMLTKKLLTDPRAKSYLDILERRDKARWAKDTKQTSIKAESNGINLEFVIKE